MNRQGGERKVLETTGGYYVIHMGDNEKDVGQEDAISDAIEEVKEEGLSGLYEEIEQNYTITTTDAWKSINRGSFTKGK